MGCWTAFARTWSCEPLYMLHGMLYSTAASEWSSPCHPRDWSPGDCSLCGGTQAAVTAQPGNQADAEGHGCLAACLPATARQAHRLHRPHLTVKTLTPHPCGTGSRSDQAGPPSSHHVAPSWLVLPLLCCHQCSRPTPAPSSYNQEQDNIATCQVLY